MNFTLEDTDLISLINKRIATASVKSEFMHRLQGFLKSVQPKVASPKRVKK